MMSSKRRLPLSLSGSVQGLGLSAALGLLSLALLAGCAKPLVLDATLPQQFAEISCLEDCRLKKESCHADARHDYRRCEAGYDASFKDYRWCLASASERQDCGYPWWSCAENLHGYCANRHTECKSACQSSGY